MSNKIDLFLINLPWWDADIPYCGPAVLKGIAASYGYNIHTYDFSLDLLHKLCKSDATLFQRQQLYFTTQNEPTELINDFYQHVVDVLNNVPCEYIGISVFSEWTHKATLDILTRIKGRTNKKILLGGRGLNVRPDVSIHHMMTDAEKLIKFDQIVKKRKLADYMILGDGEDAIIDFLSNGKIDSDQYYGSNKNLDYPFSNFDDVDFSKYRGMHDKMQIPVVSSKGCVRSCDFCDVAAHMKHFQSKDGKRLAEEMIYLAEQYNVYSFALSDSIANGNMKSLKECCQVLAAYNKDKDNDKKIKWAGNWIARYLNTTKPEMFDLLAESGCESLVIGVESGSNHVLMAMNKKSSIEGVYYELAHLDRVGIQVNINSLIGHWSEEYEHFLEHIDFLITIGPYIANRTITIFNSGDGFNILMDTPATTMEHLILETANYTALWYSRDNPNLTLKIKLLRVILVYTLTHMLNYPAAKCQINLELVYEKLLKHKDYWNAWTIDQVDKQVIEPCPTLKLLDNFKTYVVQEIQKKFPTSKVKVVVNASDCKGDPNLIIKHNDKEIYNKLLEPGKHEIEFEIVHDFSCTNSLSMVMNNKDPYDTEVDSDGNILKDKNIAFENIVIDKIDVAKDSVFFYKHAFMKSENGQKSSATAGLYFNNSEWRLEYEPPFWKDYLSKSHNYVSYSLNSDPGALDTLIDQIKEELLTMDY